MNHRQISLLMVLMLAILLSMTLSTTVAQEGDPAEKPMLAAARTEVSQSASPPANLTESEVNDSFENADEIEIGDVISGKIGTAQDQDFFKFWPNEEYVLIEIDAQVNGSELDAVICLYDGWQDEVICNDDSDGVDSLIYSAAYDVWGPYFIRVREFKHLDEGGDDYFYTLSITNPWLISSARNGTVEGVQFKKADVLAWQGFNNGSEKWSIFFDASDMDFKGDLEAVGQYGYDGIKLALNRTQRLSVCKAGGICTKQLVKPQDVIGFKPESFGPYTSGKFYWVVQGSDYCLSSPSEKIDALDNGYWLSTSGRAKVCDGQKFQDEDIFAPFGSIGLDGSSIPGLAREDIVAMYNEPLGSGPYLTIKGRGKIYGNQVNDRQIFLLEDGWGGIVWDGRNHNFNHPIDAIER